MNNNKNAKTNKTKASRKRRRLPRRRNNPRRPKTTRKQALINSIPMAVPSSYKRYFTIRNMGQTAVRISGCDLIYKIPNSLSTLQDTQVITLIPANPAYWTGTRIAAIAQGYQNYRPISLKIHYCPQCPVTQQGNVIGGTLWDDVPSVDSLQQSLKTSNGGFLTQCYQPISSTIRLKSNLQMNLYRMSGKIDQQSNPFYFIALTIATLNTQNQLINPGIFYVEYSYVLKNPIGSSTQYLNSGITTAAQTTSIYANAIAITCAQLTINQAQYPPGTRLDVEMANNSLQYYYNNTGIPTPTQPLWFLMNQPISMAQQQKNQPSPEQVTAYYIALGVITDQTQVSVPAHYAITYQPNSAQPAEWTVVYNPTSEKVYHPIQGVETVYQVEFNENGLPGAMTIESSNPYLVTLSMSNILIDYQPLPGKKKTIDYGIIGPDSKDPDFNSSLVHSVDF